MSDFEEQPEERTSEIADDVVMVRLTKLGHSLLQAQEESVINRIAECRQGNPNGLAEEFAQRRAPDGTVALSRFALHDIFGGFMQPGMPAVIECEVEPQVTIAHNVEPDHSIAPQ